MLDLPVGARHPLGAPLAVALPGAFGGEAAQVGHLGEAVGARGTAAASGRHELQVEGAGPAQLGRPLDRAGPAGEAAGLLVARAQVGAGAGRQPAVELVEAAPGPDGGHGGGQPTPGRGGVVGVGGGDDVDAGPHRDRAPGRRCGPSRAGRRGRTARRPRCGARTWRRGASSSRAAAAGPCSLQGRGHCALAAAGEHQPVVAVRRLPARCPRRSACPSRPRPAGRR